MAFAWLIGYYLAGMSVSTLVAGFPLGLFTILFGITLLFSAAQVNGMLDQIVQAVLHATNAKPGLLPLIFFFFSAWPCFWRASALAILRRWRSSRRWRWPLPAKSELVLS